MPILQLSEEERERIAKQCEQDPSITEKDIAYLKEWISKRPHLPQEHEDIWLKSFLSGCKYSLEKCKKRLDRYFTVRSIFPRYFSNRDPASSEVRETVPRVAMFFLPELHPSGCMIAFAKVLDSDINSFDLIALIRRMWIVADCVIREAPNLNMIFLVDNEGFTLQHAATFNIPLLTEGRFVIFKSTPFRYVSLHVLKPSTSAEVLRKLVWPFVPEKYKDIVHFHTNIEDVYEFVPKEMLPNEYGGNAGSIEDLNEEFHKRVESCRDWFLEHSAKKTDESKRPEALEYDESTYGIEGSFRQLNID